jgi:hypothetical protein
VTDMASSLLLGMRIRKYIEFEDFNEARDELQYLITRSAYKFPEEIVEEIINLLFSCDGIAEVFADDETLADYLRRAMLRWTN